jgi:hypothetical protein
MNPVKFTDKETEGAVEKLVNIQNGHAKTNQDMYNLLLAIHHDSRSRDESIVDAIRTLSSTAALAEGRLTYLENKVASAPDRMKLIAQDAVLQNVSIRRIEDPPDSEFTERRESAFPELQIKTDILGDMMTGWRVGRWIAALALIAVIGWVLPFWADSCASNRAEQNRIHSEQTPTPIPTELTQ